MTVEFYERLKTKIVNSPSNQQSSDRFNVRFLGIKENIGDFVSRQVKTITPRTITFDTLRYSTGRTTFQDVGKIAVEPLTIVFNNDDAGILNSIFVAQVMRQKGIDVSGFPPVNGSPNNSKFDIKLEYFNLQDEITHYELYRQAFIMTLIPNDMTVDDNTPAVTTVVFNFDSVDYSYEGTTFMLT